MTQMKKLILILLSCLIFGRVRAQENCIPVLAHTEEDLPYQSGEYAVYAMRYVCGIINSDVAKATVRLDTVRVGGQKCFHCSVFGKTAGIYKLLFNIKEDFQSWFTCDGVRPVRFMRDTYECGYVAKNEYNYVWDSGQPYIDASVYTTAIDSTRHLNIPLKACTFDLPSLYYNARSIDMSKVEQDKRYPMTFAIDDEVYDVYYIYKGKEMLKIKGIGTVPTLHFQAKLLAGEVFKGDQDMDIYVSDDLNRVPLFFSAKIAVGMAEGRLLEYGGLKYSASWEKDKK